MSGWVELACNLCVVYFELLGLPRLLFVSVCQKRLGRDLALILFKVFYEFCFFTPFIQCSLSPFLFFLSRPMLKLPRWGYLVPFIALSLDGVFRSCFARVFTFLLVSFSLFISFACSKIFYLILLFGFGLPTSVLRGHFCPGNVISRSMFLVWVNWKG